MLISGKGLKKNPHTKLTQNGFKKSKYKSQTIELLAKKRKSFMILDWQ